MSARIVSLIPASRNIEGLERELTAQSIAGFRSIKVAGDYEEQIRQNVFLTRHERYITFLGAMAGLLTGMLLTASLLGNNGLGQVLSPLLANTLYSSLFTGAGVGLAAGGLLGGLYALSRPLPGNFTGDTLLVIYCDPKQAREARKIIREHGGIPLQY